MIEARNLHKKYGQQEVVKGIDLHIPPGEIYGFLGPNGAGKTTTILMLLGILPPDEGEIRMFGRSFDPENLEIKKRIGVVPEKHPILRWSWITVQEYLDFFAGLYSIKKPKVRISHLLGQMNLENERNKKLSALSRGMLQKVSIIRALLHDPDILFLDEPISGLDPIGISQVRSLIEGENREGRTIFISSHLLSEMEKICHRVAIVTEGRLRIEEDMKTLLSRAGANRKLVIRLDSPPPTAAVNLLEQLPFVGEINPGKQKLEVTCIGDGDFRKEIARTLYQADVIPLSMRTEDASLEETFLSLTSETVERFL